MSVSIIGGNTLSPFYSTALFVPYSGATQFVPFASQTGFQYPFAKATPRRKRGLADTTHSWYPQSRGHRQTQITFDCLLNVVFNPDSPPENQFTLGGNAAGYQMYLTLGTLANYPVVDTSLLYYWCPSVFVEEIPHNLDLEVDPVDAIGFSLLVRSNGPCFFVPADGGHGSGQIGSFEAYAATFTPSAWAW